MITWRGGSTVSRKPDDGFDRIERRAWAANFQDGLWDVFLGLLLLALGVYALLSDVGFVSDPVRFLIFVGLEAVAIVLPLVVRKYVTEPRLGRVRYSPARRVRVSNARIVVFIRFLRENPLPPGEGSHG